MQELEKWLDNWSSDPKYKHAALISGHPGIGKTTAARLVCKKLGYKVLEKNASDIRNKSSIEEFLGIASFTKTLNFTNNKISGLSSKTCIIMDEIDGMFSDRGGTAALTQFIKKTKVPIICICNDNKHIKIRTLTYYVLDIKFIKPPTAQVIKYIMDICKNEGIQIDYNSVEYIVQQSNNDIRQILNCLQKELFYTNNISYVSIKNQ